MGVRVMETPGVTQKYAFFPRMAAQHFPLAHENEAENFPQCRANDYAYSLARIPTRRRLVLCSWKYDGAARFQVCAHRMEDFAAPLRVSFLLSL
jgi:hypothetical protein